MPGHQFGEIGIELGLLKPHHVETALERQSALKEIWANSRLGEVLILMEALDGLQVEQILAEQQRRRGVEEPPAPAFPYYKDYLIVKKLGEGGMGEVFLAQEDKQLRQVVLKMLRKDKAESPAIAARFQLEAQIAGMMEHPNIVACHTTALAHGARFLVMEYIDGESLQERLERRGRLPESEVLHVAAEVLRGLAYIHDRGVIHRDIKPSNILIAHGGAVKISDFGSARMAHAEFHDFNTIVGTPNYMAPEQIRCKPTIDWRADLYSLGATLYHALSGRVPFVRTSNSEVLRAHVRDTPDALAGLTPEPQADTLRIIAKLMSKDPDARYVTARQALGEVEKALQKRRVVSAPVAIPSAPRSLTRRMVNRCTVALQSLLAAKG